MVPAQKRSGKEETRRKIIESANAVFVEFGYERATLAEISNRAGVHLQTLVRHFPTKAEMMAAIHTIASQQFEQFFHRRDGEALAAWREWVRVNAEAAPEILVFPADSYRFPVITPEGQAAVRKTKELLAAGIAEDMGVNAAVDIRPTLIACMLTAGNAQVAQSWSGKRFNKDDFVASLLKVVDVTQQMLQMQFAPKKRHKKASA